MDAKTVYLLSVLVSVGVISFVLRALPFIFFSGGTPPAMVRYIGRVLSPAAIAMLVVYCYAGEAGKVTEATGMLAALAPYLAGAVTVALQFWRHNPLLSILLGTIVYMALVR